MYVQVSACTYINLHHATRDTGHKALNVLSAHTHSHTHACDTCTYVYTHTCVYTYVHVCPRARVCTVHKAFRLCAHMNATKHKRDAYRGYKIYRLEVGRSKRTDPDRRETQEDTARASR